MVETMPPVHCFPAGLLLPHLLPPSAPCQGAPLGVAWDTIPNELLGRGVAPDAAPTMAAAGAATTPPGARTTCTASCAGATHTAHAKHVNGGRGLARGGK
jgi:hypothetical protein